MNTVLSREYLQGLPEERKLAYIDRMIDMFVADLLNTAEQGKTSYMYVRPVVKKGIQAFPPAPSYHSNITNDDLIARFQTRFLGCSISYQETWVDVSPSNRILKSGIVIDWS